MKPKPCACHAHDALLCSAYPVPFILQTYSLTVQRCGCSCHGPAVNKPVEWDLGAGRKT